MAESERFDLVVIGSGSAGGAPARRARERGWRVAVVDERPFGGTCALRGCEPKKVLVEAAASYDRLRRLRGHGLAGEARLDWPALARFVASFTEPVPAQREASLREAGIEAVHGHARFVAPDRVEVGARTLVAERFVLAVGARPRPLAIPGEERLATSADVLALERLPARVAFVGAGYVSMELAHVVNRAGAAVTLLSRGRPLAGFEPELVERLVAHGATLGIELVREAEVVALEDAGGGATRVLCRGARGTSTHEAELVVHGAGRVPAVAELGLDAAGIALDAGGGIAVDARLRSTTNPRVWAGGDALRRADGRLPLTPVAARDGAAIAAALLGEEHEPVAYEAVPSVVFSDPPLARVGLSEREARARGLDFRGELVDTSSWSSSRRLAQPCAAAKVLVETTSGRILGAHVLGPHAAEQIDLFALAMQHGLRADALERTLFAYPTAASDLASLL